MADLLNLRLADLAAGQAAAKQAHWTVRGPGFIAVHELFDQVAEAVEDFADLVAERIQQLGGHALGTLEAAVKATELPPYPVAAVTVDEHIEALASLLSRIAANFRAAIDLATTAEDAATGDLFTEVVRGLDKYVWFIEAHQD